MKQLKFQINNAKDAADLYLYDDIGVNMWGEGITPQSIADALDNLKGVTTVNVHVNSPGGDVFAGMTIYSKFNAAKQNVVMFVDGLAASAASVIVMAGDEIHMAAGADLMIHNAWAMEVGDAEQMRKTADVLEQISGQIANIYAARSGQSLELVKNMINAETWLTAEAAVDLGFATDIMEAKRMAASVGNYKYRNAPDRWLSVHSRDIPTQQTPKLDAAKARIGKTLAP
jgi:ATP-dependent Clp protease, protease subunit